MNECISIKQDYIMIMHNPLTDEYSNLIYHVIDISNLNGKKTVNIQQKLDDGTIKRITIPHSRFLYLIQMKFITKLK